MQHDPAIIAGVTLALETTVNEAIDLSLGTREAIKRHAGKVIAIYCTSPDISIYASIDESGFVAIQNYSEADVTVALTGSWRDFQAVATASDPAGALVNSDVTVTGDTAALMEIQKIVVDMDIDWESPLVSSLGDVVGHQLAVVIRSVWSWRQDSHQRLKRQVSEFIIEEGQLSPSKYEIDAFLNDVDDLVLKVDRLESRIRRMQSRFTESPEHP